MNGVGNETRTAELEQAYAVCREIAKREAKNFYWAFACFRRISPTRCARCMRSCARRMILRTMNG